MILLLHYQNLSASNAAFVIIVEILHVLIKIIPFKMRANNNDIIFLNRDIDYQINLSSNCFTLQWYLV
jgi:hypothetical protein